MNGESPKSSKRPMSVGASLALLALALVYFQLGPWVSKKLGISLPGVDPVAEAPSNDAKEAAQRGPKSNNATTDDFPGGLKSYGNVMVSRGGLRYTPGSAEGHRLKHVLRHTRDMASREIHGVFDMEDQEKLVSVIDEAYQKAQSGSRGVKQERQQQRTIYIVEMGRRVGYLGGQVGQRKDHPPCTKVKLVLDDKDVITAFPVNR